MQFTDRMIADGEMKLVSQGMSFTARVARGGNVQVYRGAEIGDARNIVRVYRPEAEVFRRDAVKTYAGAPVTLGHPGSGVTPETWKDTAVGEIGEDVIRDGEFVRVPILLRDAGAINAVEAGTRELSMGYDAQISFEDGVSTSGEAYDAVMSGFRMNHVAIVPRARGGSELRIGDGADSWGASPVTIADRKGSAMTDIKLRTVVVGDDAVSTTDEGATAIEKLKATAVADAKAASEAIAAKDEEIGRLKADLKQAQDAAKIDVDKLVADRAALVATINAIDAGIDPAGKSDADLRRAAVSAKLGDEMVKDASDAEISGMFRAIARTAKTADPVAAALRDGTKTVTTSDQAYSDYRKGLSEAWQKPFRKEA